ncbi:MAG: oligosaccharide flippase family protein [Verrucomicrobiota bacterium]|nr:oligosaccharide flippase family protein [Verrucomicrobiota bacterium]
MRNFLRKMRGGFGFAAPAVEQHGHAQRRSRRVMSGAISAFVARALTTIVSVAVVPLTLGYLGSERYGIWVTIATTLALLNFIDFGLEDSLTNALGSAFGRDAHDVARRYVSSAFSAFCLVSVALLAIGSPCIPRVAAFLFPQSSPELMQREIVPAIFIAFGFFALRFPLLITGRVLAAYQENFLANIWSIAGSIANLVAVLAVIWFHGGLPWLVIGSSGVGFVISIISAIWLFGLRRPWLRPRFAAFDGTILKQLFSSGWKFFIVGALWLLNTESDTVIISHFLGATQVTVFNVTFQLFTITMVVQRLVMPSLWPAYTEAYTRHDFAWMRRAFRTNARLSFFTTGILSLIFICFGQQIIRLWAGESAVPPVALLLWMGIWNLLLAQLHAFGTLLNALARLRVRLICGPITALLNILLSVLLVRRFGVAGVTAATVVAFLLADYVPLRMQILGIFREFRVREKAVPAGKLATAPSVSA